MTIKIDISPILDFFFFFQVKNVGKMIDIFYLVEANLVDFKILMNR